MEGEIVMEEQGYDLSGHVHVKFLNRLLDLEEDLLEYAGTFVFFNFKSK